MLDRKERAAPESASRYKLISCWSQKAAGTRENEPESRLLRGEGERKPGLNNQFTQLETTKLIEACSCRKTRLLGRSDCPPKSAST